MSRNFPLLLAWAAAALLVAEAPVVARAEGDPPLERRPEDVDDLKRLEAEKKPDEKQLVPELGQPGRGGDLADLVRESERNLKEIQRLLEEIENDLAQKETGAPTQQRQREAVEKMEKLLETLEKSCSQGSSSQQQNSSGSQQKQQSSEDSSSSQKEQEAREQQKSSAKLQESEAERRDGKVENDKNRDSLTPESRARALREQLLQYSRRWGLLPPKLRDEMLSSTGREAPQEYLEIISRYYKRLTDYYQESPPPSK